MAVTGLVLGDPPTRDCLLTNSVSITPPDRYRPEALVAPGASFVASVI